MAPVPVRPGDRGDLAHEDGPALDLGSVLAQVVHQRRSDVGSKRQAVPPSALAGHDNLSCSPVDVVEAEAHHLPAAQSESAQQHHDRVVPAPDGPSAIAGVQQ
jgi:hypothetical protein